ncbi:MAG: hypothetical protein A2201_05335 [Alicyclobacillus sp. RIFOXYA1_FULL_53_8]|nr:MAG: hypothetical protein A2201_05335 [Alicyclobacillus sp. RIFOXYA1_FULL_53_8]
MWKKAFILLLSFNLLLVVGFTVWWGSLPKASQTSSNLPSSGVTSGQPANVQVAIGSQAINSYLQYALTEQKDVQKVLSDARVDFSDQWNVQLGIKLTDRIVPFTIVFNPQVQNGNLLLQVQSATMGEIPIPTAALMFVFRHLPWPNWITTDAANNTLALNFTQRAQNPYGIYIQSYSPVSKLLTLQITILPKALLKGKP